MRIGLADNKKNRVCIIFPGNIFTTPFLKRYTDILKQVRVDYDVVYWDLQMRLIHMFCHIK